MDESPTPDLWWRWLDEHAARLLLFARQQTRTEADAQDLMQEALIESGQRQGNGLPPATALVFTTIRRRAIDWARSDQRRVAREQAAHDPAPVGWFDNSVEDREMAQLIQNALTRLPDIYREVITLKIWGGLTFAEIAPALGIPANTAASRYRYGLAELRKLTREVLA